MSSPTDAELQVLSVLWERGPATARQVLDAMPDGKSRSYTTVLSTLQLMEKKGLVAHTSEGRAHVYRSVKTRRRVLGPVVRRLVQRAFMGRPADVVQHLLQDDPSVDAQDLSRMRAMIDEAEAKLRKTNDTKKGRG